MWRRRPEPQSALLDSDQNGIDGAYININSHPCRRRSTVPADSTPHMQRWLPVSSQPDLAPVNLQMPCPPCRERAKNLEEGNSVAELYLQAGADTAELRAKVDLLEQVCLLC